jgi:cytochrome c556
MKKAVVAGLALTLASAVVSAPDAGSAATSAPQPLELKSVMNELSREMQRVVDAIAREDWATVEQAAPRIANHREPPVAEKTRILTYLGGNVAKFKGHDGRTHEAAEALGSAAARRDGLAVIAAFQSVQTACFGCHREFRGAFVEHFYGRK